MLPCFDLHSAKDWAATSAESCMFLIWHNASQSGRSGGADRELFELLLLLEVNRLGEAVVLRLALGLDEAYFARHNTRLRPKKSC